MSKDEKNREYILGNGMIIKGLTSIIAVVLLWLTLCFMKPGAEIFRLAFFASLRLLVSSLISSYGIIFQIKLKMAYFEIFIIMSRILTLALIYAVAVCKGTLFIFFALSLLPLIILLLLVKHYSAKILKPKFSVDFELWRKIFRESWPLGLAAFFIFIYNRTDQIILFHFRGSDNVGLYSAASRLAESFNIIPLALMTSVLPLLSQYYEMSQKDFERFYRLSFKYLLIFIIPVASFTTIFSDSVILLFFGKGYLPASQGLRILIWAEVFVFVGIVNNSILIAMKKQKIEALFTGASALVNIVLNLIFIPKYGVIAAAAVSLISYSIGPIMGYFIPLTRPFSCSMFYYSLRPALVSLLVFCFIYYAHFSFLAAVFSTPLIYLLIMYYIKGFDKRDILVSEFLPAKLEG